MKICNDCKIGKALEEFSKRKASADGLQQKCKACVAAYSAKNKERRLVQARARYAADPEKERKRSRLYKAANAERVIEYGRANYRWTGEALEEIPEEEKPAAPAPGRSELEILRETVDMLVISALGG